MTKEKRKAGRPPQPESVLREINFNNIVAYELKRRGMSQERLCQEIGMSRPTMSDRLKQPLDNWYLWEVRAVADALDINFIFLYLREEDLQKRIKTKKKLEAFQNDDFEPQQDT